MGKIKNGDTVSVHYTGRLEDGTTFDSSKTEGREPLTVTLGEGMLIKGFEEGLIDMVVGESKTIEIEPENAYGNVNHDLIVEVPRGNLPENLEIGQMLTANAPWGQINVKVVELNDVVGRVDGNHPLAGKKLIFDLEVTDHQSS